MFSWSLVPALAVALLFTAEAPVANAQSAYYLSPRGSDAAGQGTQASPWASLSMINALDLEPGDQVLLEGGATFAGTLYFGPEDGGTATAPVVIGSYGEGRATIHAGDGTGLLFYNSGGFSVSDLILKGSGGASHSDHGIVFYNDLGGDMRPAHARVDRVDVGGFNGYGLAVIGGTTGSGYRDVRITNSDFFEHEAGARVCGPDGECTAIQDLYIGHCRFFDNAGGFGPGRAGGGITQPSSFEQEVSLRQGWNLVARWVEPLDVRFDVLLAGSSPAVKLVRRGAETVYCASCPSDEMGRWEAAGAYRVYASEPVRFTIAGEAVAPEAISLPLRAGWNDVPYLRRSPIPVEEALASIAPNVVAVKDFTEGIYLPKYGINTIGSLQPGRGYQVYVSRAAELAFPPNASLPQ